MAQVTILASGLTASTSSDIVLADGQTKTVGIFAATDLPGFAVCPVMLDTPGADVRVTDLTAAKPAVVLAGPGTFRVLRPVVPVALGVFTEG